MLTRKVMLIIALVCVPALAAGSLAQAGDPTPFPRLDGGEISESGSPTGSRFLVSPLDTPEAHEWYSSVAYNSQWQEYLVVWHASTATNKYIYGQFLTATGALIGSRFMISPPVGRNLYPDVAYNPDRNEYLVVYMVETATADVYGIYGMRLDAYGAPLGGERCFATSPPDNNYWHPAVAYEAFNDRYLVTWQRIQGTFKGIEARTLPGDGSTMESSIAVTGLLATLEPSNPDVACNLSVDTCLVVWQEWYDATLSDHEVRGQRVDLETSPHLEGTTFSIFYSTNDEGSPAVSSVVRPSGIGEYLVVAVSAYASSAFIYGQLLTDAGALDGSSFIISPYGGTIPAIAGNELTKEFLVAWKYGSNIQARTVNTSGSLGLYAQAVPNGSYTDWPAVAAGQLSDFLVTFHDQVPGYNFDIFGQLWGNRLFLPAISKN